MALTFKGGVFVGERKRSAKCNIEYFEPKSVLLPCGTHSLSVGQSVACGEALGEDAEGIIWHASVAGTVKELLERNGRPYVRIERDESGSEICPVEPAEKSLSELSPDEIVEKIRLAGIFGLGGGRPTYKKLMAAMGRADRLIINCAESEPYASADHRVLLERPEEVVNGAKILLRALAIRAAYIGIEENKYDCADAVDAVVGPGELVRVRMLKTKYPQGSEKMLIHAITGRELGAGHSPEEVGCMVVNCRTCAAVFRAIAYGKALTHTVVTVDGGAVPRAHNIQVPIGTSIADILEYCGVKKVDTVVLGGAMTGRRVEDTSTPVISESSLLCTSRRQRVRDGDNCVRCGKCVTACPMNLVPAMLYEACRRKNAKKAQKLNLQSCIECGACAYVCPARLPILEAVRSMKEPAPGTACENAPQTELVAELVEAQTDEKKDGAQEKDKMTRLSPKEQKKKRADTEYAGVLSAVDQWAEDAGMDVKGGGEAASIKELAGAFEEDEKNG